MARYYLTDVLHIFTDINECLLSGICKNAECLNTKGSYRCLCKPGFMLDTESRQCVCKYRPLLSCIVIYRLRLWLFSCEFHWKITFSLQRIRLFLTRGSSAIDRCHPARAPCHWLNTSPNRSAAAAEWARPGAPAVTAVLCRVQVRYRCTCPQHSSNCS